MKCGYRYCRNEIISKRKKYCCSKCRNKEYRLTSKGKIKRMVEEKNKAIVMQARRLSELAEINGQARKLGLSYGKYVAMRFEKIKG